MQASNFQDALASVARTVGRKSAAVVFGGTNAYTDGDTIHLRQRHWSASTTAT